MKNIKDVLSTIVAILFPFIEPINYWLLSNDVFNWKVFIASLLASLIAYSTGKNADLSKKTDDQVVMQEKQK
ncbi:MAG: hypothetical protein NUV65_05975 [Candidatus Roizmanbacteria bacterium]|nr:hypothetical protein [Candidatus Roizmanbacteria bacterium]